MSDPLRLSSNQINWDLPAGIRRMSLSVELSNTTNEQYLFKIKGTSMARYIVQPAHGLLNPFQKIKVTFLVNLSVDQDTSRPVQDQFKLYALIAPPNAENKEGLDEYIKAHVHECHQTRIKSTINFLKPEEGEAQQARDTKELTGGYELIDPLINDEKLFHSAAQTKIPLSKETSDQSQKADLEIFESKLHKTPDESLAGNATIPLLGTTQFGEQSMGATQIEKTGIRQEESDAFRKLKETNLRLKADLKNASVI